MHGVRPLTDIIQLLLLPFTLQRLAYPMSLSLIDEKGACGMVFCSSSDACSYNVHQTGLETSSLTLSSPSRGEKHGFITFRCSEHAALSLRNGATLRKRNEPSFHLSYGGLRHFRWPRYTDYGKRANPNCVYSRESQHTRHSDFL